MPNTSPIFVEGLDLNGPVRTGSSRQFHRKSRNGCQKCRARRVKCNEAKPRCHNCERQNVPCIYDRQPGQGASEPGRDAQSTHPQDDGRQNDDEIIDEPVESPDRRMIELELLHFYVTETAHSIPFDKTVSHEFYVRSIPRMAFKSKGLLYSMFATTALHRSRIGYGSETGTPSSTASEGTDWQGQHTTYMRLALQHHRRELNAMSIGTVDLLFTTANLLRLSLSVNLMERELEPYQPPIEWLRMATSHQKMYRMSWDLIGDDRSTQVSKLTHATPLLWKKRPKRGEGDFRELEYILEPLPDQAAAWGDVDNPDEWDEDTREAYEYTLSFLCYVLKTMKDGEGFPTVARNIVLFSIFADDGFVSLVAEARPRALVVLAHYFALMVLVKNYWYVCDTGVREVRAIADHLPPPWHVMMQWPLEVIQNGLHHYPSGQPMTEGLIVDASPSA